MRGPGTTVPIPQPVLWVAALVLSLAGCQRAGDALVADTLAVLAEATAVLEAHAGDPAAAASAMDAWLATHGARLAALDARADALRPTLDDAKRARVLRRFLDGVAPVEKRLRALADQWRDHPEALARLEALGKRGPGAKLQD